MSYYKQPGWIEGYYNQKAAYYCSGFAPTYFAGGCPKFAEQQSKSGLVKKIEFHYPGTHTFAQGY